MRHPESVRLPPWPLPCGPGWCWLFAWGMVFLVGSQGDLAQLTGGATLAWLVLSGLATGASWLCYFRALQLGDVNKVTPIDKSSTVLTILLAWLLLGEPLSLPQGLGVVADRRRHPADDHPERRSPAAGRAAPVTGAGSSTPWARRCLPASPPSLAKLGVAEHRVQPGHRHPHHCGAGHGLGDGAFSPGRQKALPQVDRRERDLHLAALGAGHRGLLAVLLPGPAEPGRPAWWCPLTS